MQWQQDKKLPVIIIVMGGGELNKKKAEEQRREQEDKKKEDSQGTGRTCSVRSSSLRFTCAALPAFNASISACLTAKYHYVTTIIRSVACTSRGMLRNMCSLYVMNI